MNYSRRKEVIFKESIPRTGDAVFLVNHFNDAKFDYPLHYHPEYELTYIQQCSGNRLIGDSLQPFKETDLVFIGKNLPHQWEKHDKQKTRIITVQFGEEIFSDYLIQTSLFKPLKILLEKSQRGLKITGGSRTAIINRLNKLLSQKGFVAFNNFMAILQIMANAHEDYQALASEGFSLSPNETKSRRINLSYNYILKNYHTNISQKDLANLVGMSESAFSHFFKKHTNLSFTDFLINVRLGKASKLLLETNYNISEVCYQTGFRNIANFNRQFKRRYGSTPSQYRKNVKQSIRGVLP